MSLLDHEVLSAAVNAVLDGAREKPRKFLEAVELQVVLQNYDVYRDKRFSGKLVCPHVARPNLKVCIIGDAQHCQQAQLANIPHVSMEDLRSFNRNKKHIKKWMKGFDCFLSSVALLRQIPRVLGPSVRKFPTQITHADNLELEVEKLAKQVKFQLKKVFLLGASVGHVRLTIEELQSNVVAVVNFLTSLTKDGWKNIKLLRIKSAMGKPHVIYIPVEKGGVHPGCSGPSKAARSFAPKDRRELQPTLQRTPSEMLDHFTVFIDAGRYGERLATVMVTPTDTVLKLRVAAQGSVAHAGMRLFFRGAMLLESQTVQACGICHQACILAVKDLAPAERELNSPESFDDEQSELIRVVVSNMGGNMVAEFHMEQQQSLRELRQHLKQGLELQYWQQLLILDDGTFLKEDDDHRPLAEMAPDTYLLNLKLVYQRDPPEDVQSNSTWLMRTLARQDMTEQDASEIVNLIRGGRYDANVQASVMRTRTRISGGQSPLQLAIRRLPDQTLLEVVNNLMYFSADVNSIDPRGMQPLHVACQRGGTAGFQVASFLLANRADVDKISSGDQTVLHLALQHLRLNTDKEYRQSIGDICYKLISAGADVNFKNGQGRSSTQLVQIFLQLFLRHLSIRFSNQIEPPLHKTALEEAGLSLEVLEAFGIKLIE